MSKRTYAGPIIERGIERAIAFDVNCSGRSEFHHLAVDSGTGELAIICIQDNGISFLSSYTPSDYMPETACTCTRAMFTVTDDLSEREQTPC